VSQSESPFDRLGARADSRPQRARALTGGETAFRLAHEELGEWRVWRELLEFNAIDDPFDLQGRTHSSAERMTVEFGLVEGDGADDVDLAAELGQGVRLVWATPELEGRGELLVTDTAFGAYTLAFRAPGEDAAGAALAVVDADLEEADGSARAWRGLLTSQSGRYAVDLEVSPEAWLILWLARCVPVVFAPERARSELLVPELT
jgi:hypothetical protein